MNNPYNAPTADLSRAGEVHETYMPSMFQMKGRIGRVRYIGYAMGMTIIFGLVMALVMGLLTMLSPTLGLVGMVLYIPMLVLGVILAIRRFHDLGKSGWFALLIIIPIVNFFVSLWLIFGAGSPAANGYGLPPAKNTKGVILLACLTPVVSIAFIVAMQQIPAFAALMGQPAASQTAPAAVEESEE